MREDKTQHNYINKVTSICIIARRGAGKTALAYKLLESATKKVYVYKHPNPKLIIDLGFNILYSLHDLEYLENIIVWIDEPQLFIKKHEKKGNDKLMNILSIARHRNICIMLSTSDTRFITKSLESYMDIWIVKDIEANLVKRGSLIKVIIRDHTFFGEEGFKLNVNEYLFYSRDFPELGGKHTFQKPLYFTDEHSKPFGLKKNKETELRSEVRQVNANGTANKNITKYDDVSKEEMIEK